MSSEADRELHEACPMGVDSNYIDKIPTSTEMKESSSHGEEAVNQSKATEIDSVDMSTAPIMTKASPSSFKCEHCGKVFKTEGNSLILYPHTNHLYGISHEL